MHGADELRAARIGLDFLPQPGDRLIDRARRHRRVEISPHFAQQLVAMHDLVAALRQVTQQLELAMRQADARGPAARGRRPEIDQQAAHLEAVDRRPRAPQHHADSRQQLVEIGRLGDVIVGAQLQPSNLVDLLATSREDDDRDFSALME